MNSLQTKTTCSKLCVLALDSFIKLLESLIMIFPIFIFELIFYSLVPAEIKPPAIEASDDMTSSVNTKIEKINSQSSPSGPN